MVNSYPYLLVRDADKWLAAIATRANENVGVFLLMRLLYELKDIEYSARNLARLQMVINILSSQRFTDFLAAIHIISIVAAEGAVHVYNIF
jgi:hypothetical protein